MSLGDRHQKKDIEAALRRAEAAGFKVLHDKKKHTWGYVICCPCSGRHTVSCTPKSSSGEARRIDIFVRNHRGCA